MSRSKTYSVRCGEPGCPEKSWHEYERASDKRVTDWKCYRHRNPEELLTESNRERVTVLTVQARDDIDGKHFFDGKSGIVSGPGFKVIAADWPVGTQLVVAARMLIQSDQSGEKQP